MAKQTMLHVNRLDRYHYQIIGEIIFQFSTLDYLLTQILSEIMGLGPKQMRLAFVNSDVKGRLTILATLASKWVLDVNVRSGLNALKELIFNLETTRNLYAHSIFGYPEGGDKHQLCVIHMRTGEQRHLPEPFLFDLAHARKEVQEFRDATNAAKAILDDLRRRANDPRVLKQSLRRQIPTIAPSPQDANQEEGS